MLTVHSIWNQFILELRFLLYYLKLKKLKYKHHHHPPTTTTTITPKVQTFSQKINTITHTAHISNLISSKYSVENWNDGVHVCACMYLFVLSKFSRKINDKRDQGLGSFTYIHASKLCYVGLFVQMTMTQFVYENKDILETMAWEDIAIQPKLSNDLEMLKDATKHIKCSDGSISCSWSIPKLLWLVFSKSLNWIANLP